MVANIVMQKTQKSRDEAYDVLKKSGSGFEFFFSWLGTRTCTKKTASNVAFLHSSCIGFQV